MSRLIVIDTCVLVSALRSSKGASYRLVMMLGGAEFEPVLSVPLVLEYEDVLKRMGDVTGLGDKDVDDLLDYFCDVSRHEEIHFLWRPVLKDSRDDHVLELAVEAGCEAIVTHNVRDFVGSEQFGIEAIRPGEFLRRIGGTK